MSWLRRAGGVLAVAVLLCTVGALAAPAATAATPVRISATVNGQALSTSTADHPVRLHPARPAVVAVTITDAGSQPVTVTRIQIAGRVLGLAFFSFDTAVSLAVAPQATAQLQYDLDLTGLRGQATGLIGGSLTAYDSRNHVLARTSMVSDVRGSVFSVYGLFGLVLLVLTAFALLDTALALARHLLPQNRWRRGLRFLTPGVGIGLVMVFTLSALRFWVPTTDKWVAVAVGFAVVFFLVGYLVPTPGDDDDGDGDDDDPGDDDPGDDVDSPGGYDFITAAIGSAPPPASARPVADAPPPGYSQTPA